MKVKVISVLDDNYMYLVIEERTRDAIAVDASVAKKLLHIVRKENANLKAILTTHHHLDHSRGNADLVRQFPELHVYGTDDRIGGLTHRVVHNQLLKKVFCGHEYTVRNLKFALKVEPDNEHVKEKLAWAKARDDDDIPTVPSSLEEEFLYNPFMRVREESVQKFTGKTDPVDVMRVLRKENDEFKKPKDRLPIPALLAYQWGLLNQSAAAPK
ncbi:hypothetical protein GDO78_002188 [Eleutherodactylus coqui]|uniref:Hydroxyacylglutathione hydrolase n=1 Tax=Eleutherodactylus coqui TaxID=57060 RepID=A0A8J6K212_ELECQ|nr:hypothetical protein GDO78_002188 [Eleutherodactylus coqui]